MHDGSMETRAPAPQPCDQEEVVVCFFSGRPVRRADAVRVKLGVGNKVWVHRDYFRKG